MNLFFAVWPDRARFNLLFLAGPANFELKKEPFLYKKRALNGFFSAKMALLLWNFFCFLLFLGMFGTKNNCVSI